MGTQSGNAGPDRILIVDDEPKIRQSLAAMLGDDFLVVTTGDPGEGLEILREGDTAVVLSDQRMPRMSGVEFLARASEVHPATRILITGYSDLEALVRAVNEGKIYGYVAKPWSPPELRSLVHRAAQHYHLALQLRRERDLLRRVMETSPSIIRLLDREGRVVLANPAAMSTYGLSGPTAPSGAFLEPQPMPAVEVHRDERPVTLGQQVHARVIATGQPVWGEEQVVVLPDGRRHNLVTNAAPLLDEQGQVEGVVVASADITDRCKLEEHLRQAQKMEAVGRLAGGVAHDFNNMLTGIGGFAEMALFAVGPDSPAAEDLRQVGQIVERAAALTRQLLAFSRRQPLQVSTVRLDLLVVDLSTLLRRLIGEDVRLEVTCPAPVLVRADAGQLEQVVLNLAVNARDAMPRGGELKIATGHLEAADERPVVVDATLGEGKWAFLSLADTGSGMDEQTAAHIFEPFFTTKPAGKGTGLGLATVYGIVKQHGGSIAVDTAPGKGTRFTIYLPAEETAEVPSERVAEAAGAAAAPTAGTLLLVEDEASVRELAARVLRRQGYTVHVAGSGEEAARLFGEHAAEIALLVSDLVLPDCRGLDLYRRLAAKKPGLEVLFMSGYAEPPDAFPDEPVPLGLLAKPFTGQELLQRVGRALEGEASTRRPR